MNKHTTFQNIAEDQFNWKISIYREQTSIDKAQFYSRIILERLGSVIQNLSSCTSDLTFSNFIIYFETLCRYSELKNMVNVLKELIESPFEIMCDAEVGSGEYIIGISSYNQIWGCTISKDFFSPNFFKEFLEQCEDIVLVHGDEVYLNYTFKSAYFEVHNPLFNIFLITPYPSCDECFPWKDNGVRYNIRFIPNETLWDTSGDDLSILPEMW